MTKPAFQIQPKKTEEELQKVYMEVALLLRSHKCNGGDLKIIAMGLHVLASKLQQVEKGELSLEELKKVMDAHS
jgi:hypothetical protein